MTEQQQVSPPKPANPPVLRDEEPIEDLEPDRTETELVTGGGYRFRSNLSLLQI